MKPLPENKQIIEMYLRGVPILQIAVSLGLTKKAVANRLMRMRKAGQIPQEHRDQTGENNPMYGKRHSQETKRKISLTRKPYVKQDHPSWKGGRRKNHSGYLERLCPEHPRARGNGYVFEHILVAEQKIGRQLLPDEVVHHLNEIKTDNRPENLVVIGRAYHSHIHAKKEAV